MNASTIPSTDSSLIVRLQTGDDDAWQKFVDLYGPWVYAWTRRYSLSPADGADVTQETLLAVHRAVGRFRRDSADSSFRGWLWTILRNKIRDFHRRAGVDVARGGTDAQHRLADLPDGPPDESAESQSSPEMHGLLHRGLIQVRAEFEERTWRAFWLVAVEGRSPIDVAAELDLSPNAVRQAKSRVLRRLRLQLGEADEA